MAAASVVSLEEFRETHLHTEARQRLHDCFDSWLDEVEGHVKETPPMLERVVQVVLAVRQELLEAVTQNLVVQEHRQTLTQE